jgi:transcriptional regulator with PAS, ATPase and Fis domain
MMPEKLFRTDLFYRLNVIALYIPPLRERRDDIMPLTEYILKKLSEEAGIDGVSIDPEAGEILENYDWHGNVRELQNVLERTLSSLEGNVIYRDDLPFYLYRKAHDSKWDPKDLPDKGHPSLKDVHGEAEKRALLRALTMTGYNKKKASELLGIHRTLLYKKMKKYNISLRNEEEMSRV